MARLVGFCLLATRSLFEEIGGFDEGFGIGNFEDDELSARVLGSGRTLRVADGAVVLHHGSATFDVLDLDHAALMTQAGRHFAGTDRPTSGLVTAVVLGDGDPAGAAATAVSALTVADRVRVLERAGATTTAVHLGAIAAAVDVIATDWTDPLGALAGITGVDDRFILVLQAGETVDVDDWGRARARLEALPDVGVAVNTATGYEVRLHPPGEGAIAAIGDAAPTRLDGLRVA